MTTVEINSFCASDQCCDVRWHECDDVSLSDDVNLLKNIQKNDFKDLSRIVV